MKLRRISEKLEKDYLKRKALACIGLIFPSIAALTIIFLAVLRTLHGSAFMMVYIAIGFLLFGLTCYIYLQRLLKNKSLIIDKERSTYIEIDDKGIFTQINVNGKCSDKKYTWNELTKINRLYIDIGFFRSKPKNYKLAIISDNNTKKSQVSDFLSAGVLVELYDEMVNELLKYRKEY